MLLNMIKNTIWLSSGICLLGVFPRVAYPYDYSTRHSFCSDYASNRSSISSSTFQYDLQKSYKKCMKNADNLIRNHEKNNDLFWEQVEQRRIEYEQQKIEEARKEAIRQREIQDLVDNADELFY